ncbi:MAG: L,D-transpeptidase family protein [Pseudomonadota bacterium]
MLLKSGLFHKTSLRVRLAWLTLGAAYAVPGVADTFALPPPGDDVIGKPRVVVTRERDTLLDIARAYDLGYEEIVRANPGVDPWLPKPGTRIILPTQFILPKAPRTGIVLNVPEMRLYYFPKAKEGETPMVVTHPIGIGREGWATPLGETKVVSKRANPNWYVPISIQKEHAAAGDPLPKVVPAGPDNPLGNFAMPLGIPGYLIHGTNKPFGIGRRVSHGCIQLYPEDIESLFKDVPVGTPVRIVNQPYKAGWLNGTLYFETHAPLEEDQKKSANLTPMVNVIVDAAQDRKLVDWDKATEVASLHVGLPVPISSDTPGLAELLAKLNKMEPAPNEATLDTANEPSLAELSGKWVVQAGGLESEEDALRLAAMLRHLGPPIPALATQVKGAFQIFTGPFGSKKEALAASKRIKSSLEVATRVLAPEQSSAQLQGSAKSSFSASAR